ncbi:hypothetical protein DHEL01_v207504 [Diaporthe helianthi]|uniref:Uncharacterized protein n=1 Tax=Diaporthe helianthi TaxID=158607 RepID=A0A2P5HV25_DIAHE|nr:hypothetical protein DHEL01_v207504 [Diaporthe helianthi]
MSTTTRVPIPKGCYLTIQSSSWACPESTIKTDSEDGFQPVQKVENHIAETSSSNLKLRPILTNLNGDNSWLVSFPIPDNERQPNGKAYFHIVSDPWLTGPAITLGYYAIHVSLPHSPAYKSGSEVEAIAYEIERLAQDAGHTSTAPTSRDSVIDLISIAQQGDDHKHEDTLRTFRRNIPVVAAPAPASAIRAMNHFETVVETLDIVADTPSFGSLHPGSSVLPAWLNIFRLKGASVINFATAFVWSHPDDDGTTKHEVIINPPHGIKVEEPSIQRFISLLGQDEHTTVLTLLHSLKSTFSRTGQSTFGVEGGLELERLMKPKYWINTGDAKLIYWGIVFWLLGTYDVFHTLDWGLQKEAEKNGGVQGRRPNYLETANGDWFVLEK